MTYVTRLTLGVGAVLCDSRSLALARFADLTAPAGGPQPDHRNWMQQAIDKAACPHKTESWRQLLLTGLSLEADDLVFGLLRGRLVVNAAGGIPDHAGLSLDRLTGVPFIPGSAVKGCARRMALQRLRAEPNPSHKIELLLQIVGVFGSSIYDWQPDSDFAWACTPFWPATAPVVRQRLGERGRPGPNVIGDIRFLPAYPWFSPEKDLELDVISCHHPSYYQGKPEMADAPDIEEPMVLFFPAIAPGHVFAFALPGPPRVRPLAAAWLREGLAVLGLGAKTTSGYGWFDTSDAVQAGWREKARQLQGTELERQRRERELVARARQEEAASRQAAAQAEAMANMTPQQLEDLKIAQLTLEQFRSKLQSFPRHVGDKQHLPEQLAIVRALQKDRLAAWDDLKQRAQRGGPWAQAEQAIRQAAKKANLGKMP